MADLENTPAMPPPEGITPNFINPPSQAPTIIALLAVFTSLMLLVVGDTTDDPNPDQCGSVAHMIIYALLIPIGYGRHLWDYRASNLIESRMFSATGVVYPITIFFAKTSLLLLYLRIFSVDRSMRIGIWSGIIFQALFYTTAMGLAITAVVKCNGVATLSDKFCQDFSSPVIIMVSSINVITDFYVLILPIRNLLKLRLPLKHKLGLMACFAGGLATCAASLARLINFCQTLRSSDILWDQATNAQFTIVEMNIAIIIACVSTFPAFFAKTKVLGSSLYRSLRTRLVSSHSTNSFSNDGHTHGTASEKYGEPNTWHGHGMKQEDGMYYLPKHEGNLGVVGTVVGGKARTASGHSEDAGGDLEQGQQGIFKKLDYSVRV
ncbi:MAG: hypothetical protein M1833_001092 [Piccolia ochrophora]|nr:MAG: hypothetical protein M1833_001092 [Piccolia ochrophora]